MTHGLKAALTKMECYPYLTGFVLFVSFTCKHVKSHITCKIPYRPNYVTSISGTYPPRDLRCPENCNCTYVKGGSEYRHDVNCSYLSLTNIPSKKTVPTDVAFYVLNGNKIETLKNDSFNIFPVLDYLDLQYNQLKGNDIEFHAFRGLTKLRYLAMNNNDQLSNIRAEWFVNLVSLENLHLHGCGINTLESDVFKSCKHLKKLDITNNHIVSWPTSVFQNLSSLMCLYMRDNKINKLPHYAFVGSNSIQAIDVSNNVINTINENVGFQNLIHLQSINVAYNKFTCDCNLVWFRNWINKTINITFEELVHAQCFLKNEQSGTYQYVKGLLDFHPNTLQCSQLIKILRITIPSVSAGVVIVIIGSLLYYFRYDLRYWKQRRRLRKQYEQINKQGPPQINGENIKYDAFVAYNSKDQHWIISVLQPSLEIDRNFKLCVDYRDFIAGEAVVDNIANAVKYSRKVLLVVSKHFIKSEWCYFELEMARMRMFDNQEDILVVVVLEKVPGKDMPILLHKILTTKTYIEWEEHAPGQALFWTKLEAALLSPNCLRYRLVDNPRE